MVRRFCGSGHFIEKIEGVKSHFLLAGSVTKTCEIEGITQAGIPGLIPLTPTLDAEFVDSGRLYSLEDMAKTPKGVPTPAIITRAVRQLTGFDFACVDLGLVQKPHIQSCFDLEVYPSQSILEGAMIDAKALVKKGEDFARRYAENNGLLMVGESTPSGTTTAYATAKALGYKTEGFFSSSFAQAPSNLKESVVLEATSNLEGKSHYDKLSMVSDNMLLFCAGFVSAYSQKEMVILGGGTQMAAVLLVIDALGLEVKSDNIALMTTKWVYEDHYSDIKGLLEQLSFQVDGYYADFGFKESCIPVLKLYDQGEAKEGVGAGAALCYAKLQGYHDREILEAIEKVLTT